jgi:hypothetical protein
MEPQPNEAPVRCLDCPYAALGLEDGERHAAALGHRVGVGEDE